MTTEKPRFCPFDPRRAVVIYRRHLPHWRQDGACYFVTYRLHDSIPAPILAAWQDERNTWLTAHGMDPEKMRSDEWAELYEKVPLAERRKFERRNRRQIHDCLDVGHGSCYLRQEANAHVALEALLFFHRQRCWTGDAVVMPNHTHALLVPRDGFALEGLLQSVKRHSSREINKRMAQDGRLWQKDSYDHIVRDRDELVAFRRYIAKNAVQAGLKAGEGAYHRADWMDEFAPL